MQYALVISPSGKRIRVEAKEVVPGHWYGYRLGTMRRFQVTGDESFKTADDLFDYIEARGWDVVKDA